MWKQIAAKRNAAYLKKQRKKMRGYAGGGLISGPGTGTSDSILARVSNGEAIIPAKSVARNPQLVNQLVSGNLPKYSTGTEFLFFSRM